MELEIYQKNGKKAGRKLEVADSIFAAESHEHAVYLALKTQITNSRHGTSATKTRSDAAGGGRKPWKQKGRGTSRAGSIRSPLWRGGGTTHGPQPHEYRMRLPRKVKKLARISVLSSKVKEEAFKVLEDFSIEEIKAREISSILKNFGLGETKTLILLPEYDSKILQASRNIKNLKVQIAKDASTYELLDCKALLVMESAVKKLEGVLAS